MDMAETMAEVTAKATYQSVKKTPATVMAARKEAAR
jgi:hypothetical protein